MGGGDGANEGRESAGRPNEHSRAGTRPSSPAVPLRSRYRHAPAQCASRCQAAGTALRSPHNYAARAQQAAAATDASAVPARTQTPFLRPAQTRLSHALDCSTALHSRSQPCAHRSPLSTSSGMLGPRWRNSHSSSAPAHTPPPSNRSRHRRRARELRHDGGLHALARGSQHHQRGVELAQRGAVADTDEGDARLLQHLQADDGGGCVSRATRQGWAGSQLRLPHGAAKRAEQPRALTR